MNYSFHSVYSPRHFLVIKLYIVLLLYIINSQFFIDFIIFVDYSLKHLEFNMNLKKWLFLCTLGWVVLVSCSDPYSYTPPESSGPGIPRPTILIEPHDVTVNGKNIVRINSTVDDGIIYYTTDGSTPSILSSTRYYSDVGIPVEDTVTIKAIVAKDGKKSPAATRAFYKLEDAPRLLVHWNSLEINSSYPYVYYVENSIENDPAKMNQYDEVIVPSVRSVSGIRYTVVVGKNGYINSVLSKDVYTSPLPTISDAVPYLDYTKVVFVSLPSGDSGKYTTNGTDPSPSNGKSFSGGPLTTYHSFLSKDNPTIKAVGASTGKLSSEIVSRQFR